MGTATALDYQRRLNAFLGFCDRHGLSVDDDPRLELAILEYFDALFANGEPVGLGTKLAAALGHWRPHLQSRRCATQLGPTRRRGT